MEMENNRRREYLAGTCIDLLECQRCGRCRREKTVSASCSKRQRHCQSIESISQLTPRLNAESMQEPWYYNESMAHIENQIPVAWLGFRR